MPTIAVIGANWGDEGKGKIVDLLAERADVVIRFSGGNNAGHTVINNLGEFRMHLIPSGIFYPKATCIIGPAVVVDPAVLLQELSALQKRGIDTSNLVISDRAHLIMPYHTLLDGLEEEARGKGAIGTTRKGVGPAFVDKVARMGIRVCDLMDKDAFRERLTFVLEQKNSLLKKVYRAKPLKLDEVYNQYCEYGRQLAPYVRETEGIVAEALRGGQFIMLEGAQGTLLDLDFGTYPYVTSAASGGASLGMGIGGVKLDGVLGVFKAYTTRVGSGPMPTELHDKNGDLIRERAHEYGTTTGRPRRCGWFDAVIGRYSTLVNGFTGAAITRFDILDMFPKLKICTGYDVDGTRYDYPPASAGLLARCQPIYEELPGWESPTTEIRRFEDLPPNARAYVQKIERLTGCPVSMVSVGPGREQTIMVRPFP